MRAREPKACVVVQEGARQERVLGVTVLAERPEAPKVGVAVAVDALRACAAEGRGAVGAMAALTRQEVMGAPDLEGAKIMVDRLIELPPLKAVAALTVSALLPLVYI